MDKLDRRTWGLAMASVLLAAAGNARAEFPEKPVTLVVPFAAGGPSDKIARDLAEALRKRLNQTVIVENVPPGISQADHDEGLRSSLENLAKHVS